MASPRTQRAEESRSLLRSLNAKCYGNLLMTGLFAIDIRRLLWQYFERALSVCAWSRPLNRLFSQVYTSVNITWQSICYCSCPFLFFFSRAPFVLVSNNQNLDEQATVRFYKDCMLMRHWTVESSRFRYLFFMHLYEKVGHAAGGSRPRRTSTVKLVPPLRRLPITWQTVGV